MLVTASMVNQGQNEIVVPCELGENSVVAFMYKGNMVLLVNSNGVSSGMIKTARNKLVAESTLQLVVI